MKVMDFDKYRLQIGGVFTTKYDIYLNDTLSYHVKKARGWFTSDRLFLDLIHQSTYRIQSASIWHSRYEIIYQGDLVAEIKPKSLSNDASYIFHDHEILAKTNTMSNQITLHCSGEEVAKASIQYLKRKKFAGVAMRSDLDSPLILACLICHIEITRMRRAGAAT